MEGREDKEMARQAQTKSKLSPNPVGRLDILLNAMFDGMLAHVSAATNLPLQEHMKPVVEKRIKASGIGKVKIPDELLALGGAILARGREADRMVKEREGETRDELHST